MKRIAIICMLLIVLCTTGKAVTIDVMLPSVICTEECAKMMITISDNTLIIENASSSINITILSNTTTIVADGPEENDAKMPESHGQKHVQVIILQVFYQDIFVEGSLFFQVRAFCFGRL